MRVEEIWRAQSLLKIYLEPFGLDIVQPLALKWYNEALRELNPKSLILPREDGAGEEALIFLVGNTKAVWKPFVRSCSSDPGLLSHDHPLDEYVERSVYNGVQRFEETLNSCISRYFWSHRPVKTHDGSSVFISMQKMASCAGLAYMEEHSHLSILPNHGPWFALRAALVLDHIPATSLPRPPTFECPLSDERKRVVQHIVSRIRTAQRLCNAEQAPTSQDVKSHWQLWVEVRDAIAPDHPERYSDAQIYYHYTSDREILQRCIELDRIAWNKFYAS